MSISSNGYVCLGKNSNCSAISRPSPHDILVGLNYDLNTERKGSGQIYYQQLSSNGEDFKSAKEYVNRLNPMTLTLPTNVFMITYDDVLPYDTSSLSLTKFQLFLLTETIKSYIIFKFISCPAGISANSLSGLNHKKNEGNLQEIIINDGQQCTSTNVNQTGIWVSEVTNSLFGIYDFSLNTQAS